MPGCDFLSKYWSLFTGLPSPVSPPSYPNALNPFINNLLHMAGGGGGGGRLGWCGRQWLSRFFPPPAQYAINQREKNPSRSLAT